VNVKFKSICSEKDGNTRFAGGASKIEPIQVLPQIEMRVVCSKTYDRDKEM